MKRILRKRIEPEAARVDGLKFASFDLNLLRVFDALLATRSVSSAAARLGLSQPATSSALARLRKTIGDPLLVRNGNRMVATSLAEELRPRIARALADIEVALSSATRFDPLNSVRRFRVGANDYAALVLLAPLVKRLQQTAPHATLEVLPLSQSSPAELDTRELDLIIADRWHLREVRNLETLFQESFVSIARIDHPRLSQNPTLKEFLREGHALISAQGSVPGIVDYALEAQGHFRRVVLTVPHYLAAPIMVSQSDLIMTLPSRIVKLLSDTHALRTFAPPIAVSNFDIVMAFHSRSPSEPATRWLMDAVRAVSTAL
jgi:DNA-binding transcriptional LysR family regulator